MTDWELMVPGIGLTVVGMVGVGVALSGIAKTLMEGMHAISALVMFIGMIILAAGILKDGLPRSNQAKAATLIIIGFMVTFGAFAVGIAQVPALFTLTGILFLILIPSVAIGWAAHKKSPHFKAIAILFSSGSVVGIITFLAFGAVAPQPIEAGVMEQPAAPEVEITGPKVEVAIVEGASTLTTKAFDPAEVTVTKGTTIVWTNNDGVVHTVTSGTVEDPRFGSLFDSLTIKSKDMWSFNTKDLELGEYTYFCTFHPTMIGKVIVN